MLEMKVRKRSQKGGSTFTAAAIASHVVSSRAGAAVATRCVHAGMQAQLPSLAIVEELALVNI